MKKENKKTKEKAFRSKTDEIHIINRISSPRWKIKYPQCSCPVKDLGDCNYCKFSKRDKEFNDNIKLNFNLDKPVKLVEIIHGTDESITGWCLHL